MGAYGPSSVTPHKNVLLPVEEWNTDTAYTELSVVFYNGSLWVAAADNDASAPSSSNADWSIAVAGATTTAGVTNATEIFTILHPALRTLNSLPIALVTPPTATSMVVPQFVYQLVKPGTVVFSGTVDVAFSMPANGSGWSSSSLDSFDGSVALAKPYGQDIFGWSEYVSPSIIGIPLFIVNGFDLTGGDGTVLTLILTYQIVETAGLI